MCIYIYVRTRVSSAHAEEAHSDVCIVEVLCVVANSTIGCRNMSKFGRGGG